MSFNQENSVADPSQVEFNLARKTDLLNLAKHYNVSYVKSSMRKQEIKKILVQHLVDEEIFDETALSLILEAQPEIRLRELELKYQLEQEKVALEREKNGKRRKRKRKTRKH